MNVTVILCTYNRGQSLVKALDSVAASIMPQSVDWEVLVVDNNSKDQTRVLVQEFCRRHPGHFRYLFEPTPGKSFALRSGICAARGDVLAFMDDDVLVDPMWLQNLTAPLQSEEFLGAGGRILPNWTCPPPDWVPMDERRWLAPFAVFDLGLDAGPLEEPPFGTNMAFRRRAFEKYNGFRFDLGPRPGSEIRGEDTEFGHRLLSAGERLWYAPSAIVHHEVTPERLTRRYFLQWWFDKGRADVREYWDPRDSAVRIAGVPLYMFRRIAKWTVRWLITVAPSRRFSGKLKVWSLAGGISESYRLWRGIASEPQISQDEFQVDTPKNG